VFVFYYAHFGFIGSEFYFALTLECMANIQHIPDRFYDIYVHCFLFSCLLY
jgi:hypothetical protein